jgi:hypothetical protein
MDWCFGFWTSLRPNWTLWNLIFDNFLRLNFYKFIEFYWFYWIGLFDDFWHFFDILIINFRACPDFYNL